jgi:hypothetical protein
MSSGRLRFHRYLPILYVFLYLIAIRTLTRVLMAGQLAVIEFDAYGCLECGLT